jgi:hypothetical protein
MMSTKKRRARGPASVLSADADITFQRGTAAALDRDLGGCNDQSSAAHLEYVGAQPASQRKALHDSYVKRGTPFATLRRSWWRMHAELVAACTLCDSVVAPAARGFQKLQRCALLTRKSRNACTRATDFSSSG